MKRSNNNGKFTILLCGDVFAQTRNSEDPFKYIKKLILRSDIAVCNLEAALTELRAASTEKLISLRADPEQASFLQQAGFQLVNLANNHILDYGATGLAETIKSLDEKNIHYIGAGRSRKEAEQPVLFDIKGKRVAFFGFTEGGGREGEEGFSTARISEEVIRKGIAQIKQKVDLIFVSLHWGLENVFFPSPEQQQLARNLIEEGASVIFGHHPHFFQGIERYREGLIFYSLGNFNFYQFDLPPSIWHRISALVRITSDSSEDKLNYTLIPIQIDDCYQPRLIMEEEEKNRFNQHIEDISQPLKGRGIEKKFWIEQSCRAYLVNNTRSFIQRIRCYGIRHIGQFFKWLTSPFTCQCAIACIKNIFHFTKIRRNKKSEPCL